MYLFGIYFIFQKHVIEHASAQTKSLYDVSIKAISSTKHLVMSGEKKEFNWNYDHCVLPIPVSEIDANPNMVQNPGY